MQGVQKIEVLKSRAEAAAAAKGAAVPYEMTCHPHLHPYARGTRAVAAAAAAAAATAATAAAAAAAFGGLFS